MCVHTYIYMYIHMYRERERGRERERERREKGREREEREKHSNARARSVLAVLETCTVAPAYTNARLRDSCIILPAHSSKSHLSDYSLGLGS